MAVLGHFQDDKQVWQKKIMQYKIFCQSIKKMRDQNMTQTVAIMLKETQLAVL